jgi:hypothetical protein
MSIIGFVPGPEEAATVVAWTRALTGSSDETEFLCLEIGFGGRTEQAVREALGEAGADPPTLTAIRDPMPVTAVLEHARKANACLLEVSLLFRRGVQQFRRIVAATTRGTKKMKWMVGFLALLMVLAGSSVLAGETVMVTVRGFVESNQIGDPPLGDAQPDDEVTMTLFLDSDIFLDSANFPVRGYVIDEASYTLQLGSVSIGLQDPFPAETPYFVIRNDDPAVDGFFTGSNVDGFPNGIPLNQVGIFGNFRDNFSVTYGNDPLPSLDILDALGTYDFTGLTVFGWTIDDGPFNAMLIVFDEMTIELAVPPTPPGVPDGADGPPMLVRKFPNNDAALRLSFSTNICAGNTSHHLLYGFGSQLPTSAGQSFLIEDASCGVGGSPFSWVGVPDPVIDSTGLLWFLMLTNDGVTTEGSWGTDSAGQERVGPGAGGSSDECGIAAKDLSNTCGH